MFGKKHRLENEKLKKQLTEAGEKLDEQIQKYETTVTGFEEKERGYRGQIADLKGDLATAKEEKKGVMELHDSEMSDLQDEADKYEREAASSEETLKLRDEETEAAKKEAKFYRDEAEKQVAKASRRAAKELKIPVETTLKEGETVYFRMTDLKRRTGYAVRYPEDVNERTVLAVNKSDLQRMRRGNGREETFMGCKNGIVILEGEIVTKADGEEEVYIVVNGKRNNKIMGSDVYSGMTVTERQYNRIMGRGG